MGGLAHEAEHEAAQERMAFGPLWTAKARVPPLPRMHVPRPRLVGALQDAVQAHRLVMLAAGALTGKTTLLAEVARAPGSARVVWYSVDEVDTSSAALLDGLTRAVRGSAPPLAEEMHLLGALVGALEHYHEPVVLILDDLHRAVAAAPVVDRLLRYLPPRARLVISGWPGRLPALPHLGWLEEQGQVATLGAADLRLDAEERARFRTHTGRDGNAWAVSYRPGGQRAVVERLRRGALPALTPAVRPIVDALALLPGASPAMLGAILGVSDAEVSRCLAVLRDQTILLEPLDAACGTAYRLSETARLAALADLDPPTARALHRAAARALMPDDPAHAAHLYALAGDSTLAAEAARRVSWWDWRERQTVALAVADLLPETALCQAPALALVAAHHRRLERGSAAVHAFTRALRPGTTIERIERALLLAQCCAARARPWGLARCVAALETLTASAIPGMTVQTYAYGLHALGIARGLAGAPAGAADALRACLNVLALDGADDPTAATLQLSVYRALAVAERRLGHLDEAERLYAAADRQAERAGTPHIRLELMNNRAVLLQQRGAHAESAEVLRAALASPWSGERGLRPLLQASLADALAALGDAAGAARAARAALADVGASEVYGLSGPLRAVRALLLAEGGQAVAAQAELAAGASPGHPAALLARAVLCDPHGPEALPALRAALTAAGSDRVLGAQARAHLARVCALRGDRVGARRWADALVQDRAYPLTPREAAILGPHTRRVRHAHPPAPPAAPSAASIVVRFFGTPLLAVGGRPLGNAWWGQSKGRELLWYALAHGQAGFTREEACADLYPDLDGEHAGRALRNLLYELRRLLRRDCGVGAILMPDGGRLRLRPEELGDSMDVDTAALERRLARLRGGESEGADQVPLLVAGPYLADLHADWTRPFRHYWEREAVHALDLAAAHFERAGRAGDALACLSRELELCPDDAALVRRVLLLYRTLDDQGGIRATFLAHRRALREELGVEPEPALTALYETLVRT